MLTVTHALKRADESAVRIVFNDVIVVKLAYGRFSVKVWEGTEISRVISSWNTDVPFQPNEFQVQSAKDAVSIALHKLMNNI